MNYKLWLHAGSIALATNGVAMAEARHFYQAIDFLATRRRQFTFDRIISGTYTLDKATEALRKMAAFQEVKPLILPRVSS